MLLLFSCRSSFRIRYLMNWSNLDLEWWIEVQKWLKIGHQTSPTQNFAVSLSMVPISLWRLFPSLITHLITIFDLNLSLLTNLSIWTTEAKSISTCYWKLTNIFEVQLNIKSWMIRNCEICFSLILILLFNIEPWTRTYQWSWFVVNIKLLKLVNVV